MKKMVFLLVAGIFLLVSSCDLTKTEETLQNDAVLKSAHNHQMNFRAHLSGDAEMPDPVETNATGQAIFKLSKDGSELSYKLIVANIDDVRMAHIHLAPADANGPIVVWLYPSAPPAMLIEGTTNGVLAEGVITSDDISGPLAEGDEPFHALIEAMKAGNTYVNVHTLANPPGEIRGQIFGK